MNPKIIAQRIANKHNLLLEDILSRRKYSELVAARKEIIIILHKQGMSASAIGRFLGKKDHTSVLYFLKGRRAARFAEDKKQ